jgi:Nucleoside-diphosphate-sugar pyrophosphorylase involved in lipopolysaccharide biosynthesis/translation initiation factor 2B, gamma/epsilon subunits (eIF-2Bgamma/eIF-2Bepsilon)
MQAVINATATESNLAPLDDRSSTFLLDIGGKTLIERTVDTLVETGVERIAMVTEQNSIRTVFGGDNDTNRVATDDVEICFVREYEPMTTGLADDSGFLYVRGDILYDADDLESIGSERAAIGYVRTPETGVHGRLSVHGDDVTARPDDVSHSGYHMAYAYKFPPRAHEWNYGVSPMTVELADTESPTAVELSRFDPIRNPSDYLSANTSFAQIEGEYEGMGGSVLYVDKESTTIHDSATIMGPTVIGRDVHVGANSVVDSAVVLDGASIGAGSYVGYSVIGSGVTIEENVTTNTRQSSGEDVIANFSGERTNTGRANFGAIVGSTATIQSGVTVGRGKTIKTGLTIDPGEIV